MKIKVIDAAKLLGGKIVGDENAEFSRISRLDSSEPGDLTLLYSPAYTKFLESTQAAVVLIKPEIEKSNNSVTYIELADPQKALLQLIENYFKPSFELKGIDNSASIDSSSKLGDNCGIGKNVVIEENCKIGEGTVIYHNTVIHSNCKIGKNCIIFSNVSIRENSEIGDNVIIHSNTVIGSDGFGYDPDKNGIFHKIPQIGNVIIEDDVELGSNVSVDRAAFGSTIIKKGTKIDNLVQIAHNVVIGENTVMSAQTGISGSTRIGSNCMFGGQVGLAGHIEVTNGVMIAAQSGVSKSITESGKYFGSPAKKMSVALRTESHIRNLNNYAEKIKLLEEKILNLQDQINKDR
jgi:UDP-3-O-[3-hydroxymyristoyl] glucosamine N-acyltransferase